jgi:hypothetical protein
MSRKWIRFDQSFSPKSMNIPERWIDSCTMDNGHNDGTTLVQLGLTEG